ncbi:hypothetical protein AB0K57_05075 [Streptomyces halstedii]|uniref:hypothetical protein n=1 Tax=Streptomyces halstedii TaxID=1944 RepID=UPI0034606A44
MTLRVGARLRALHEPDSRIDALVVATCSMERLGLPHLITERISPEVICPPLGAAIIAFQTREDDKSTCQAINFLHDPATATEAEAERLVLRRLGGFCNAPLAGYCRTNRGQGSTTYTVRARSFAVDGGSSADVRRTSSDARKAALAVSHELTRLGDQTVAVKP